MVSFRIDDQITLREFASDDAEAVFQTAKRNYDHLKNWVHWMTPDYSMESAREFISMSIAGWQDRKNLALGIFRNDNFIGASGFVSFNWLARKTEIGYWISSDEEGRGIVSSACRRLIDFAFQDLELNRIEIRCAAENERSSAIPKRFGFVREGLLRQSEIRNGRLQDFEIYGLLASEWKLQK
jgi:ribosomal-protein-serine acetyltransferase